MEESYNLTSEYNISNNTSGTFSSELDDMLNNIMLITDCLIFCVVLPMICIAVPGLCSLIKRNHGAPVYVINVLISDLIQTSTRVIHSFTHDRFTVFKFVITVIFWIGVQVNIFFMVCISAERYIMIVHPFWFRNIKTIRTSVFVSVSVWVISAVLQTLSMTFGYNQCWEQIQISVLLLPYPPVIFFYVGTWRALSRSISVPRNDQRQIMGILALILCIYTILFLPVIVMFSDSFTLYFNRTLLINLAYFLVGLNPLFDSLLYVLMRRDAKDILHSLPCCLSNKHEENTVTTTLRESHG